MGRRETGERHTLIATFLPPSLPSVVVVVVVVAAAAAVATPISSPPPIRAKKQKT
eukprot:evm.model.NODE_40814_length_986_cov_3.836714.1